MAHQDDRATVAGHGIDHPVEILSELVDGGPLRPAAHRTAVAALVEEDQPAEIGEITPLVMPGVLVERVPVNEDDCEVCVSGPVQLDIEVHTVVGDHIPRLAAQATERLVSRSVRTAEGPADRVPLDRQPDRGATCDNTGGRTEQPGPSTHLLPPTHLALPLDRSHPLGPAPVRQRDTSVLCPRSLCGGQVPLVRTPRKRSAVLHVSAGAPQVHTGCVLGRPRTSSTPGSLRPCQTSSGPRATSKDLGHRTLESAQVGARYARADPSNDLIRN